MATPQDKNIAALDPTIRELRKAQARETIGDVGEILLGQPNPPPKDYTDQRIKLISLLDNLRKMETDLRAEQEKTGRVSLATQATLLKTLGGLGEANIGAYSDVQTAKVNAYADRLGLIDKEIDRAGLRRPAQLKEAAVTSLNALGAYAKNGAVTDGQEAAFAAEVLKGLRSIDTTNPADAGLASVYADEIQNRYGVSLEEFLADPGRAANVVPATITSIGATLDRGAQAQLQNGRYEAEMMVEADKLKRETIGTLIVEPGSFLARALNQFNELTGQGGTTEAAVPPPAPTAPREEKEAYLKSLNPNLKLDESGANVIVASDDGSQTRSLSYDSIAKMGTPGARSLVGVSMTDFLDQQEKYVLKELERLENASDLESVRLRSQILSSPELSAWAAQNGYSEFRPEQQFKALLDARRVQVAEQNRAFRAKKDTDILSREGAPVRKAGAAIRDFFRRPEEKVAPEARRKREDSADLTGGAKSPDQMTANTAATETDPKAQEGGKADGLYPPLSMRTLDFEGAGKEFEAEAEAKAKKMAAAEVARLERPPRTGNVEDGDFPKEPGEGLYTNPDDTDFVMKRGTGSDLDFALARGKNERTVQRTLNNPKFADIAKQYSAIQSFKGTDPRAYATALGGLAREVERLSAIPTGDVIGGRAETGADAQDTLIEGLGQTGREMPADVRERERRLYQKMSPPVPKPQQKPTIIPPGERGFITGPSQEAVDALNATLPPVDETDAPEPPVKPPSDEGVDMPPAAPEGTALASAEAPEAVIQGETQAAGRSARQTLRSLLGGGTESPAEPTPVASAPKASAQQGSAPARTEGKSQLPTFGDYGVAAATQAAGEAMAGALSAEEQLRARRKALLMGAPMQA